MVKPIDHPKLIETLRVASNGFSRFEVRDDGNHLVGSSPNEQAAIWSAVTVAERLSVRGTLTRVVVIHDGRETEEFISRPVSKH